MGSRRGSVDDGRSGRTSRSRSTLLNTETHSRSRSTVNQSGLTTELRARYFEGYFEDYLHFIVHILSTCRFLIQYNFVLYSGKPLITTKETEAFLQMVVSVLELLLDMQDQTMSMSLEVQHEVRSQPKYTTHRPPPSRHQSPIIDNPRRAHTIDYKPHTRHTPRAIHHPPLAARHPPGRAAQNERGDDPSRNHGLPYGPDDRWDYSTDHGGAGGRRAHDR